jgi:hypothetical protein
MGSSGGGGSSSGTQENFIRYAPYIEEKHKIFLNQIEFYVDAIRNNSPYYEFHQQDLNLYFFGAGATISSFSPLFAQYENLLGTFDLNSSYGSIFDQTVNSQQVKDLIRAEGARMSDDLESDSLPRLMVGARDLNAVNSTTFIIAKTLLEEARLKTLNKYSAELRYSMINVANDRWKTDLEWRKNKMNSYQEMVKLVLLSNIDYSNQKYMMKAKDALWPFTVMDHERVALGTMQGAKNSEVVFGEDGPGTGQKVLGGIMTGAAVGAMLGPVGSLSGGAVAGLGALLGGVGGLLG